MPIYKLANQYIDELPLDAISLAESYNIGDSTMNLLGMWVATHGFYDEQQFRDVLDIGVAIRDREGTMEEACIAEAIQYVIDGGLDAKYNEMQSLLNSSDDRRDQEMAKAYMSRIDQIRSYL